MFSLQENFVETQARLGCSSYSKSVLQGAPFSCGTVPLRMNSCLLVSPMDRIVRVCVCRCVYPAPDGCEAGGRRVAGVMSGRREDGHGARRAATAQRHHQGAAARRQGRRQTTSRC